MSDPSARPQEAPPSDGDGAAPEPPGEPSGAAAGPAVTPNPFAGAAGPREPGEASGSGEADAGGPAATTEPGGGTVLTDAAGLAAERDEYLADLQRLKADFDNYRKRVLRQQEEQAARTEGVLVTKLLPVLDNLDLARTHLTGAHPAPTEGPDEVEAPVSEEARALAQAREQLLETLSREGLERVDEIGVDFDPVVHDAVAHAPDEDGDSDGGVTVDQVMRAGYRWRGQVLRPAMVRVRG
ncbi:MAG TPA: nucleotide exchange factor GrpE [Acidimicrobiales bacterium]|nr:nucleotide exchange factor GrpE [Acidimicrobiales bacterium]